MFNIYDFSSSNAVNILYGQNKVVGLIDGDTSAPNNANYYLANQYIYSVILTTTLRGESPYVFAER